MTVTGTIVVGSEVVECTACLLSSTLVVVEAGGAAVLSATAYRLAAGGSMSASEEWS